MVAKKGGGLIHGVARVGWCSQRKGRKRRVGVAKKGWQRRGGGVKGSVAKKVVADANEIRNDIPTHSLRPPY